VSQSKRLILALQRWPATVAVEEVDAAGVAAVAVVVVAVVVRSLLLLHH
jgi:hypothetical protein